MPGEDSIDFFARYKGWVVARSITCTGNTTAKEVSAYLASVREEAADRAFTVLGIDTKSLDAYSSKLIKSSKKNDYGSIVDIYRSLGSSDAEPEVSKAAQDRDELKPFAKAYLFRSALSQLGFQWYVTKDNKALGVKASSQKASTNVPFSSEGISFMAKYKDWISIKKLSINQNTKPEEVAAHLSSIRIATDRKIPHIIGVNTENLDIYASDATGNMRKSAANLQKITEILCSPEAKKQIDGASPDASLRDVAIIYLFGRLLQNIKIDPEVSPYTLMDMFPGLKIPKPKGRMPGQKKKKQ